MARNLIVRSVILSTVALLIAACASQPASSVAYASAQSSRLDKKFQATARQYQKFRHEGQTMYCKKEKVITSAIPVMQCLSEPQLRLQVENYERSRNPIARPLAPGAGQGGIGG
ncbi:MAG TPA: hypothetical protein VIV63_02870 [Steroidobacteraceae bacterium]